MTPCPSSRAWRPCCSTTSPLLPAAASLSETVPSRRQPPPAASRRHPQCGSMHAPPRLPPACHAAPEHAPCQAWQSCPCCSSISPFQAPSRQDRPLLATSSCLEWRGIAGSLLSNSRARKGFQAQAGGRWRASDGVNLLSGTATDDLQMLQLGSVEFAQHWPPHAAHSIASSTVLSSAQCTRIIRHKPGNPWPPRATPQTTPLVFTASLAQLRWPSASTQPRVASCPPMRRARHDGRHHSWPSLASAACGQLQVSQGLPDGVPALAVRAATPHVMMAGAATGGLFRRRRRHSSATSVGRST